MAEIIRDREGKVIQTAQKVRAKLASKPGTLVAVSAAQPAATFERLEDVRCWLATGQFPSGDCGIACLRDAVAVLTRAPRPRQKKMCNLCCADKGAPKCGKDSTDLC